MKNSRVRLLGPFLLSMLSAAAHADDQQFPIMRFEVEGNHLLAPAAVQAVLQPMTGPARVYGDIQEALDALRLAYRSAGYGTVQVDVPEQELTSGVVRIAVTETALGKIVVSGNAHFDSANVQASLPPLRVGQVPNLDALSVAIQLANDNPAKQVEVVLASGDNESEVDAKVAVTDSRPLRGFVMLDNTGSATSGRWRVGAALQHANLFNRDHVATLAYTSSPDSPDGVKVNLYSLGYRIPLYALGDSLDFIYGSSSVNTPGVSPTLGGPLGLVGKGNVAGARWNHFLPRRGDYSSKLVFAIDHKYINSRCSVGGVEVSFAPPTPAIASCVPYTTRPLSISYSGQLQGEGEGRATEVNLALARNWATGQAYTNVDGRSDRYSYLTPGNRASRDSFTVLRGGASHFTGLPRDWQMRLAANGQYAFNALLASEQFGMTGAGAVRGFGERALAADNAVIVNAELYTPELAAPLGLPGNLRALLYYDAGRGRNRQSGAAVPDSL
ncbi:MAG: ShlB/FhaC/HecB family hemolysin secretion/activation protein, partial [Burkholderiaceae bacterium]|nr:ShlB/FhaC/HecB family hemolysin secretion/activation protein [Burkholderiaceae bacterium]